MSVEKITDVGGFDFLRKEGIGFTACVTEVLKAIPTIEAKGIYIHMLSKPNDWRFHRTVLCEELKIGKDKLATHLLPLIQMGLVREVERRNENGQFEGNDLFVNLGIKLNIQSVEIESPQADYPAPAKPASGKSATTKLKINNKAKDITNSCSSSDEPKRLDKIKTDLFDHFWHAYPRKEGKMKAKKFWFLKTKDFTEDEIRGFAHNLIKDVLNRKENHSKWKEKEFIPHASTYINNERWTDEIIKSDGSFNKRSSPMIEGMKKHAEWKASQENLCPEEQTKGKLPWER